jgi:hypothetical protein
VLGVDGLVLGVDGLVYMIEVFWFTVLRCGVTPVRTSATCMYPMHPYARGYPQVHVGGMRVFPSAHRGSVSGC